MGDGHNDLLRKGSFSHSCQNQVFRSHSLSLFFPSLSVTLSLSPFLIGKYMNDDNILQLGNWFKTKNIDKIKDIASYTYLGLRARQDFISGLILTLVQIETLKLYL